MSKTLLLLRHGKAEVTGTELDINRKLMKRGRENALTMAQYMAENDMLPDVIYSSPARRALGTAEIVQEELGDSEIVEEDRIYEATLETLLKVVAEIPDEYESVLLVGHNPGFEALADELTGRSDTALKTCSLAVLESDAASWSELGEGSCELAELVHPAEVAEA